MTEVGSNNYLYTPIIPLLAGADKVIAWTADTRYGKAADITKEVMEVATDCGVADKLTIRQNERPTDDIKAADVLTNSGFLRPLDEEFISHISQHAVIPLMYEKWELRESDVDVYACQKYGIRLAGTWENHPDIKVFSGVGPLAVKLAQESGFEVYGNDIIIWSDDHFGEETETCFKNFGARSVLRTTKPEELINNITQADFIYICDYHEQRSFFKEIFDIKQLAKLNPTLGIVHLYGDIDPETVKSAGWSIYPDKKGHAEQMTETLAYLGLTPVINLQTAGFKVGECLLSSEKHKLVQKIV